MSPAKAFRVTKPLPKRLPPGCWSGGSRRQKINFASQNRQPREHSVPPCHGVSKLGWHAKADSQQTKMNAPTPPRPLLTPWLHSGSSHKAQNPLRPHHHRPVWGLGERENITCLPATMPRTCQQYPSSWKRCPAGEGTVPPALAPRCITAQSPGRQPEPSDNTGLVLALSPGKKILPLPSAR